MTRLLVFVASGLIWLGLGSLVSAAPPPTCTGQVCQITGPGGVILDWRLYVLLNAIQGKSFVVPAGWCASACVLAVGTALQDGAKVTISPDAVFQVHQLQIFLDTPMPKWFRKIALERGHVG